MPAKILKPLNMPGKATWLVAPAYFTSIIFFENDLSPMVSL